MFLFDQTKEICRIANLCLNFLLAVTEVVIRDYRSNDTTLITSTTLESATVVIQLIRIRPTLTVATLALCGVVVMRKAEFLLRELGEMRRQNDESRMPSPRLRILGSIEIWQVRIAAVSEDTLNEV